MSESPRRPRERRSAEHRPSMGSPLYLVTGVMLGLIAGIIFSVLIYPLQFKDISPDLLTRNDKAAYRLMVAQAYDANPVPARAKARIALLGENDPAGQLRLQAAGIDAGNGELMRMLTNLYTVLGGVVTPEVFTPTTEIAEPTDRMQSKATITPTQPTPTMTATETPVPTRTKTPMPTLTPSIVPTDVAAPNLNPFVLRSSEPDCTAGKVSGSLRVTVRNASNTLLNGIAVYIAWPTGLERVVTVNGTATYKLESGVNYSVRVGEGGETINNLSVPGCSDPNIGGYLGDWVMDFGQ